MYLFFIYSRQIAHGCLPHKHLTWISIGHLKNKDRSCLVSAYPFQTKSNWISSSAWSDHNWRNCLFSLSNITAGTSLTRKTATRKIPHRNPSFSPCSLMARESAAQATSMRMVKPWWKEHFLGGFAMFEAFFFTSPSIPPKLALAFCPPLFQVRLVSSIIEKSYPCLTLITGIR